MQDAVRLRPGSFQDEDGVGCSGEAVGSGDGGEAFRVSVRRPGPERGAHWVTPSWSPRSGSRSEPVTTNSATPLRGPARRSVKHQDLPSSRPGLRVRGVMQNVTGSR
jgi:hypothetical protein